ncbi:hypothetical protein AAG906_022381 [Vitis piasezkii]
MEAVLPVEIEMGSLRVALEQQIPETDWAQARFDQLNLLDEKRLRAANHRIDQRSEREVQTQLERTLFHQGVDSRGRCMADGFRWKPVLRADQCGSAKEFDLFHLSPHRHYVHIRHHWVPGSWDLLYLLHFIHEGMNFDHWVFGPNFLHFYHPITLAMGSDVVFDSLCLDSGAYREPSSRARAFRCLDVVMLPSEGRLFDMWSWFLDEVMSSAWIPTSSFQWGTYQPWRRSFSHISITVSITRPRYIVFASLTIIPELFIDMSSQWSVVRDS